MNERQKSYEKSMAAAKATFDDQKMKVEQLKRVVAKRKEEDAEADSLRPSVEYVTFRHMP